MFSLSKIYNFVCNLEQAQHLLAVVPSLVVITPSISRIDGNIYEKYSANYGIFCPLMNLTKFNCHVNIAYISTYADPDLYSASMYRYITFDTIPINYYNLNTTPTDN